MRSRNFIGSKVGGMHIGGHPQRRLDGEDETRSTRWVPVAEPWGVFSPGLAGQKQPPPVARADKTAIKRGTSRGTKTANRETGVQITCNSITPNPFPPS